mgnify:CR=1 FL=1
MCWRPARWRCGCAACLLEVAGQELTQALALRLAEDLRRRAAFFGLASGYWLFMPIGGKLKNRSDEELFVKEIIIRGVLLLQSGATPSVVEANLKAYLEPGKRKNVAKEGAAA